ncbi:hypothetical protein [Shewanella sp. MBTL60-007]|nr:hypothetical protein [Shewanella sp. MBTL60-007]
MSRNSLRRISIGEYQIDMSSIAPLVGHQLGFAAEAENWCDKSHV